MQDNKLPNAPAYIFMIDVSYNSVKSGLVDLLCARLKDDVLRHLPRSGLDMLTCSGTYPLPYGIVLND